MEQGKEQGPQLTLDFKFEDEPKLPSEEKPTVKEEGGPHDGLLAQMNEDVYGPPKIGRRKGWKELYPNADLKLVPDNETIIPGPKKVEEEKELKDAYEASKSTLPPEEEKDDDGYQYDWQRIHNR